MSKTTLNALISKLKLRFDYNVSDDDLDSLLIGSVNDALKLLKQWLFDAGIMYDITNTDSFQTIPGQEYRDISKAVIIGDVTTFTGVAGDTIDVTIDSTAYADIDVSAATDIDDVVTAINSATGGTEASNNATSTTLQITSTTTGSTSNCTIADGTTGNSGEAARLFSITADRTATGIVDVDDIIRLSERTNDRVIPIIPWSKFKLMYTDPTSDSSTTPDRACRFDDRLYFGPRPSSFVRIHIDYIQLLSDLVAGGTLPFEGKYDLLLLAASRVEFLQWHDANNINAITASMAIAEKYKKELITTAARNIGVTTQSASRDEDGVFGPQSPDTGTFT